MDPEVRGRRNKLRRNFQRALSKAHAIDSQVDEAQSRAFNAWDAVYETKRLFDEFNAEWSQDDLSEVG